ncbi:MAG: LysR substrate-binding domain-containing protein, partial [Pseudomonadota bacterium]
RLPAFYRDHPGIVVNVQAPPNDLPSLTGDIDLALRYGAGAWTDGQTTRLFDEVICPVGRPDLVADLRAQGRDLTEAPLIHVRSPENRNWVGWPDYFQATGAGRRDIRGVSFDNYVQAVQAAGDGRGLMLGWRSITQALVDDGTLARWSEAELRPGTGYFVTSARKAAGKPATAAMLDWLLTQGR